MSTIALDTETTGLDLFHGCKPFAVSMCTDLGHTLFWEWPVNPWIRSRMPVIPKADIDEINHILREYDKIVFHNAKFDIRALENIGIFFSRRRWKLVEDTLVMSHILDSGEDHKLKSLAFKYLDIEVDDQTELIEATKTARRYGKQMGWSIAESVHADYWIVANTNPGSKLLEKYNVLDAIRTMRLYILLKQELENQGMVGIYRMEMDLMPIVFQMEKTGVPIKPRLLKREMEKYETTASQAKANCKAAVPTLNNLDSPLQLSKALFHGEPFSLTVIKASAKTGMPSCDASVLNELALRTDHHSRVSSFLNDILSYRKANTALKYLKGYNEVALSNGNQGLLIHPSLNQVGTSTTRFSHSRPNTANIAKQADISLRSVFGPCKGRVWLCCDYSQLELRILAFLAHDPIMGQAFLQGKDIHQWTADLCGIKRGPAKTANYAIVYGAGNARLEELTGVTGLRGKFMKAYPAIASYTKMIERSAFRKGHVLLFDNRRLTVPKEAPYVALNYQVQGSAGVLLKEAMIRVDTLLSKKSPWCGKLHQIMTIHDEIVLDAEKGLEKDVELLTRIHDAMEIPGSLRNIQTPVEIKIVRDKWSSPKPINWDVGSVPQ